MPRRRVFLLSFAAALATVSLAHAQTRGTYAPDARPGQCFARVVVPEVATTVTEQVVDNGPTTEVRVIPARYELVNEQVVVREAYTEYRAIAPTFRTVTETIVVEPARTEAVAATAAAADTYQERVLIRPAYTTWRPGRNVFGRGGMTAISSSGLEGAEVGTGEVLCRVEVPAEYAVVTRTRPRAVAETAAVETRYVPARTEQIARQVIDQPARVEEVVVPAEYRTIRVRRMLEPERRETVVLPAAVRTISRRVVQQPAGVEWREVLCETNATPAKIREIQQALTARGYRVSADGVFGPQTLAAMERFQRDNNLPIGNLTISTVEALGVSPR